MTMTKSERLDRLMIYLDLLTKLNASDYRCNTEINEVIDEIRSEIGIESDPKPVEPSFIDMKHRIFDLSDVPTTQLVNELARRHPKSVIDTLLERN